MLKQKYINVIRTCLKMTRAFGNEKSKADIEETLKAFDKENKISEIKKINNAKKLLWTNGYIITKL